MTSKNTLIIGVFGEFPYAESVGDVNIPYCKLLDKDGCLYTPEINLYAPAEQLKTLKVELSNFDSEVLSTIKGGDKAIPFVSVLLSGRPMLVSDLFAQSDALLAAWLPGTSGGQGIVDALTGDYVIRPNQSAKNTLSMDWPSDMVIFLFNFRQAWLTSLFMGLMERFQSLTTHSFWWDMVFRLEAIKTT